jgi:hypothetical protein
MRTLTIILMSLLLLPAVGLAADGETIGRVKTVTGTATITRNGETLDAEPGAEIYLNDLVETGPYSSLGIVFVDETSITAGADASLAIDEFVYNPSQQEGSFITKLTRGTVLYVSGLIAKMGPETSKVETPVGTIGIRGTKFLVGLKSVD